MKKPSKKTVRKARPSVRLVPVKGCIYTQRDVERVIGPALIVLAEKHRVDVPQLTAKQVYADIEGDRGHPLWKYIDLDPKRAVRSYVLKQIGHMMRCVRVEYAHIPQLKPSALFVSMADTSLRGDGGTGRASVVTLDAHDKTGIAKRIADGQVLRLRQAWRPLHDWSVRSRLPRAYAQLVNDVGAALAAFDAGETKQREAAAE